MSEGATHRGRKSVGAARPLRRFAPLAVILGLSATAADSGRAQPDTFSHSEVHGVITNCSAVRALMASPKAGAHPVCLDGTAYFISADRDYLILADDSGFADLDIDLGSSPLAFGDRVRLEGMAELGEGRSRLRKLPVIDNDGLHAEEWREGQVHLDNGLHRFELQFFQAGGDKALGLNWSGPGFTDHPLGTHSLFRRRPGETSVPEGLDPGLEFSLYDGQWEALPDFEGLAPARAGILQTYDPAAIESQTNFALRLTAWLRVTNGGTYTFRLGSDDGSRLFIDPITPGIVPLGKGTLGPARRIDSESRFLELSHDEFVELEGMPEFVATPDRGIRLHLKRGTQWFETHLSEGGLIHPALLGRCRLRLRGVLQRVLDEFGQPGALRLMVDGRTGLLEAFPQPSVWRMVPETPIETLSGLADRSPLVRLVGTFVRQHDDSLLLTNASGQVPVLLIGPNPVTTGRVIEVSGGLQRVGERVVIAGAVWRPHPSSAAANSTVLTSLEQVHRLARDEIQRERPVEVTATVVLSSRAWLFVRDATHAIYVSGAWPGPDMPKVGEVYRIEGHTIAQGDDYTQFLRAVKATLVGRAALPEPRHPSWDELMTGRLDAQWIELGGTVSSMASNSFVLATPGGQLTALVLSARAIPPNLEGAMVRIRGCCTVDMSKTGQTLNMAMLLQAWDSVSLVLPAPTDPFGLPLRPIGALLSYDADLLPYVKIAGVVLHSEQSLCFVTDGTNAVRIVTKTREQLRPGDAVEAVGVLDVMTQVPVLRDATVRRVGIRPLPEPGVPTPEELSTGRWDASLIRTEGLLLNVITNSLEQILEVRIGDRVTPARLNASRGVLRNLRIGSQVELTGVCVGRYANDLTTKGFDRFEVLLSSPESVRVLTAPSWWTTRHTISAVGSLLAVLLLAAGWIASLRHRVEQQTRELRIAIDGHKRTEVELVREMGERQRAHKALLVASRKVGMAEVATNVLHNVGNVLNSVNISATIVADRIRASAVTGLARVVALVEEHRPDLGSFITEHPRGRHLPDFLKQLADRLHAEHEVVLKEVDSLRRHVDHIKEIVAMQQSLAKAGGVQQIVPPEEILEDALLMNRDSLARHRIDVRRAYGPALGKITVDKHKVLQVLINLIANAKSACAESDGAEKRIALTIDRADGRIRWSVEDNGVGIRPENLTRIFQHGFTTRQDGHGFGLHSGALAAHELGGQLTAHSEGPGQGARFTLDLPIDVPVGTTS